MQKLTYLTIAEPFVYEIPKIKGSRFFWTIFPCESREKAEELLAEMRKKYFDATHHCSAYRVGIHVHEDLFGNVLMDPKWSKANDDGEPSNTAGKPILSVLEGKSLQNVLLVVTRYFGGTLLGVGGLIQAYTQTAQETLAHSPLIEREIYEKIWLTFTYEQTALIAYLREKYAMTILEERYDEQIFQSLQINKGWVEAFGTELFEKSKGSLKI